MQYLLEPVVFKEKPIQYDPTSRTTDVFPGFYHWHQCCEMLFIHEGTGSVIVDRKTYEMQPGMLFFFQPYQLHKVFANVSEETPYVRTLLFFEPHVFDKILLTFPVHHARFERLWRRQTQAAIHLQQELKYLEHVFDNYNERFATRNAQLSQEDMTMLMLHVLEAVSFRDQGPCDKTGTLEPIRPFSYSELAMHWIEEHYTEEIRLEVIAQALHLSKYYLSRIFLRETGGSLSDYIVARRIKQACNLLHTTIYSVEQIASQIGFGNVSHFIRIFKKVMGTTPLQYRRAAREAHV
jgi:AraC-like DNA-binding protein